MKADKPSTTSMMVALGSYCVAQEMANGTIDPRVSIMLREILKGAPQPFAFLAQLSRLRASRRGLEKLMNLVIPGMFTHYVARKIFIEQKVRDAIAGGCKQIVVIGGGLDTLALRINLDFPELRVFELDHPATQNLKKQCIISFELKPHGLSLQSADLTVQSISSVLSNTPFNFEQQSVFLIEGVLMYLDDKQVKQAMADVHKCCVPGSRLIVTFMEQTERGDVGFGGSQKSFVNLWLRRQSEPFVWGIAPQLAGPFFDSCGWSLLSVSSWEQLKHSVSSVYPAMSEPAQGEHVAELIIL